MNEADQNRTTIPVCKASTIPAKRGHTVVSQLSPFEKQIRAIRIADSDYYRFVESFDEE
jgi:hypothetical protein